LALKVFLSGEGFEMGDKDKESFAKFKETNID
jgi:hypothetical protein